jgi:integrase
MDIVLSMKHTVKRGDRYYFRMRVPKDVQAHFATKTEITKTLETGCPITAQRKSVRLASECRSRFAYLRSGHGADFLTPPAQAADLAIEYIKQNIKGASFSQLSALDDTVFGPTLSAADQIFQQEAPSMAAVIQLVQSSSLFDHQRVIPLLVGLDKKRAAKLVLTVATMCREAFLQELSLSLTQKSAFGNDPMHNCKLEPQAPPKEAPSAPLLSAVVQENIISKQLKGRSERQVRSTLKLFADWHGDRPINQYSRADMLNFREMLMALPTNVNKRKEFKGMSLRKIIKVAPAECPRMSILTVNNNLDRIRAVFSYALKHDHISRSPAFELNLKIDQSPEEERDPFTKGQIEKLLPFLANQKGKHKDTYFWVPLISLYSGMRLNEICQLSISDIEVINDIPCIHITEQGDYDRSLKNKTSRRTIPLHPTLLDAGFLRYAERRLKETGDKRAHLFPYLIADADGNWGRQVSRWFNPKARAAILTSAEQAMHKSGEKTWVFHSLRHTFISQCQHHQLNPRIESRYVGHKDMAVTDVHRRYAGDFRPQAMLNEVRKVDYQIDLSPIMGKH